MVSHVVKNRFNLNTLAVINVTGAFVLGVLCLLTISQTRLLTFQNAELSRFNLKRQALLNLLNESVQYGQKNPAINPILAAAGVAVNRPAVPGAPGAAPTPTPPAGPSKKPGAR